MRAQPSPTRHAHAHPCLALREVARLDIQRVGAIHRDGAATLACSTAAMHDASAGPRSAQRMLMPPSRPHPCCHLRCLERTCRVAHKRVCCTTLVAPPTEMAPPTFCALFSMNSQAVKLALAPAGRASAGWCSPRVAGAMHHAHRGSQGLGLLVAPTRTRINGHRAALASGVAGELAAIEEGLAQVADLHCTRHGRPAAGGSATQDALRARHCRLHAPRGMPARPGPQPPARPPAPPKMPVMALSCLPLANSRPVMSAKP